MYDLSFPNVMNGIRVGVNMTLLCPTMDEAQHIYRKAVDVLFHPSYSNKSNQDLTIDYGNRSQKGISIRFKCFKTHANRNWQGFQGVFLFHPALYSRSMVYGRLLEVYDEMQAYNARFDSKWHS